MYFPYLRGKQYELLAVRELVQNDLIDQNVIPVIEPIKPTSTLMKTLEVCKKYGKVIALIANPQVGNFVEEFEDLDDDHYKERYKDHFTEDHIIPSHIVNSSSSSEIRKLLSMGVRKEEILLVHNSPDFINEYKEIFDDETPKYNLLPYDIQFKRNIKENKILFADRFHKQDRNADYLHEDDNSFSEDHLFYHEENYLGFSDFSIIGAEFNESGFAPMAVAIHIVYFDQNSSMRVRHFVSDSNEDIQDPAGKFYEALEKMMESSIIQRLNTHAIHVFEKHYENESYPGLGSVKKLSLMHHLELMNRFLDGRSV